MSFSITRAAHLPRRSALTISTFCFGILPPSNHFADNMTQIKIPETLPNEFQPSNSQRYADYSFEATQLSQTHLSQTQSRQVTTFGNSQIEPRRKYCELDQRYRIGQVWLMFTCTKGQSLYQPMPTIPSSKYHGRSYFSSSAAVPNPFLVTTLSCKRSGFPIGTAGLPWVCNWPTSAEHPEIRSNLGRRANLIRRYG